jgi:DNA repair protein RecN (Recombination protein N)
LGRALVLSELHIKNFALIKDLTLPFSQRLNILTGETGAGKSIIIEALNLILGERADSSDIRTGCENASVEAVFDISNNKKLSNALTELGIELDDNILIMRRTVKENKASRNYINDKPVTVGTMKNVGDYLVDIHGQHEHQGLLKNETHIEYLDSFLELEKKKERLISLFNRYKEKKNTLKNSIKKREELKEKEELYRFQIKEIEDARLKEDEDEKLEERQRILENGEKLVKSMNEAVETLYESDGSIFDILNKLKATVENLCSVDPHLEEGSKQLNNILFEIEELSQFCSTYLSKMEFDPNELETVTERLDLINHLKIKYGRTIKDILDYKNIKQKEITELENVEIKTEKTEKEIEEIEKELIALSLKISEERKERKKELEKRVNRELGELGMGSSKFTVELKRTESDEGLRFPDNKKYTIGKNGIDKVLFLISTNPGEPPMELKKIVSGGELSRIMLALKSILASMDEIFCMIFDEADSGIGGSVAESIGDKMKKISRDRQVITITHLHQIASKGDLHIKVDKQEKNKRTFTSARVLDKKERIQEIARLISGERVSKTALEHAKTLLKK